MQRLNSLSGSIPVPRTKAVSTLDAGKLDRLLNSYGIAAEFIEFSGNVARIPLENRLHILNTMGVDVATADKLDCLLSKRELVERGRWVPAVLVLNEGESIPQLAAATLHWRLELEDGSEFFSPTPASGLVPPQPLGAGGLPVGYHRLELSDGTSRQDSLIIVAPRQAWQPECLQDGRKLWGLSAQLYSVRTPHNWGMGDFADLLQLVELAAAKKAGFLLLNPLHALDLRYPENASPYSPGDRRFLNPLYIAPALCEEFQAQAVQARVASDGFQLELQLLRMADYVDYTGVHTLKLDIFARMYGHFRTTNDSAPGQRGHRFRAFVDRGGEQLELFSTQQAALFADTDGALGAVDFHMWLQWLAQEQLDTCQQAALHAGMGLGLVRDLAVGSSSDGGEVLGNPGLFCLHARIGAPPDNFNPEGQNWGLPPLLPEQLQETHFTHFITLLRANMRSCGALRIDHVMALMRLWWCPDDGSNASGAYVHYPVEALFAILRLESVRNRCVVIGEDLGVVPPEIRRFLDESHLYSNAVFYFEKYDGWHFRKPEHYKEMALAMIANHDVPPLAAWWNGHDLVLRRRIGLIASDAKLHSEQEHRNGEKGQMLQWLADQALLPAAWQDRNTGRELDAGLCLALVSGCARVSSKLLSLQLDDLAGVDTPVNIPGTSKEYPNWRRKIPVALEDIFANTDAQALLQAMAEARTA